jgi:hypothetical protein
MIYSPSKDRDVIVRIFRAARSRTDESRSEEQHVHVFDAATYSHVSLPSQTRPKDTRYPQELRSLPLACIERLTVPVSSYESHLASFLEGRRGMESMRQRLLEAMSPGLRELVMGPRSDVRIWWSSSTPELEDYPWELTLGPGEPDSSRRVLLRGLPAENPIPTLPVRDYPRLAVLGTPAIWPDWAVRLKQEFQQYVTVLDQPLKEALEEAVRRKFEIVHIFSNGIVSSALDGILYDRDPRATVNEIYPGTLSHILSGSHVALMGLCYGDHDNGDTLMLAGRRVLSSYRAFAYLGASAAPLPSTIAPLGPVPEDAMANFWQRFYSELISNWHLTDSLRKAQAPLGFPLPIALYCRHGAGRLFRRVEESSISETQPMQVREELIRSEHLTRELSSLNEKYKGGLPDSVIRLFDSELKRQGKLRHELQSWITDEGEL